MTAGFPKAFLNAVQHIDRPGNYCTQGVAPNIPPGLVVEGVGAIGLPLTASQAEQLKAVCIQAPHGKGEKTILDTSVRNVWKLTSDHFTLENPDWQQALDEMAKSVQRELGLSDQKVQAHLYDLLLYEKGGFFLPHKDGERLDGMVATLVIVLPCEHTGGELVIRHEGAETVFGFADKKSRFATRYAAFYADCEHEVKPLTSGHRLCLVYNLTVAKSAGHIGAPRHQEHVERITELLRAWPKGSQGPRKLAIALEHEYTEDGLRWRTLKGIDRARAAVLAEAAAQAGCHVNLALLTYWESGSADEGAYYDRSRRRNSWHVHEEGESADAVRISELLDSSLTAEHWRSSDDAAQPFGALPVKEDEILPRDAIKKVKPKSEIDGCLGNEGLTLNRWYRCAAVVLWPEDRHFEVMVSKGAEDAVPALEQMAKSLSAENGPKAEELKDRCRRFAASVLSQWPEQETDYMAWRPSRSKAQQADPIAALNAIDDVVLIQTYIGDLLARDLTLQPASTLAKIVKRHGVATFEASLTKLFKSMKSASLARNGAILEGIAAAVASSRKQERLAEASKVCRPLTEMAIQILIQQGIKPLDYSSMQGETSAAVLAGLARVAFLLDYDDLLLKVVTHVTSHPKLYPLRDVQIPALKSIRDSWRQRPTPALEHWIGHARSELETLTRREPQPPSDFARPAEIDCNCADCRQLKKFLADANAGEFSFRMAQPRRQHISDSIKRFHCDVDTRTVTNTSPHVLVCTKNQTTYERLLAAYREDLEHLSALQSMQRSSADEED